MLTRILIALAAGTMLVTTAACEGSGGPADRRADEAGEMAEEITERNAALRGYGPLDRQIAGELAEERFELIIDAQDSSREAAGKPGGPLLP